MNKENWEWTPIEKLQTDQNNPNSMSRDQLDALKANLSRFGWNMPIITNMDYLIADGEQKLTAAQEMGLKEVPVLRKKLTESERKVIRQSMNKLRGSHNEELDAAEFKRILTQMDMEELSNLTAISEQELLNTINSSSDVSKITQVNNLGHLVAECPKCGTKFNRSTKEIIKG